MTNYPPRQTFSVYMPPELYEKLVRLAEKQDCSVSKLIARISTEYIEKNEQKPVVSAE